LLKERLRQGVHPVLSTKRNASEATQIEESL